jgi:hypothetical protein
MAVIYVAAGGALFRRRIWSRKFALGALSVITYYFVKGGGLFFAHGGRQTALVISTICVVLVLNAVMFVFLMKRSAIEALS